MEFKLKDMNAGDEIEKGINRIIMEFKLSKGHERKRRRKLELIES